MSDLSNGVAVTPEMVADAEKQVAVRNQAAFNLLHRLYHDKDVFTPTLVGKYPEVIAILGGAKFFPPKAR